MDRVRGSIGLGVFLGLVLAFPILRRVDAAGGVSARWLGQDRRDLCGARDAIRPNGYQDVHIALEGLPPGREIVAAWLVGNGGGEWQYRGVQNHHGMVLLRRPGATSADLYFEPNKVEVGREFSVKLKFDDGSEAQADLRGGRANPDLRMPEAAVVAKWVGQSKHDLTGTGPAVGPDGFQDARIALSRLPTDLTVTAAVIEGAGGSRWSFGPNPKGDNNAELVKNERSATEAVLSFQPDRNLAGQRLKVTLAFSNEKRDFTEVLAGATDPRLAMPADSLPRVGMIPVVAKWLGQDSNSGSVRVAVSGLPAGRAPVAAVLSDGSRGVWVHRPSDRISLDVEDQAAPLGFTVRGDRTGVELAFAPVRDETGAKMTLRLVYADGSSHAGTFPGGRCDPLLRAPAADRSEVTARPGDDLAALANAHGTVRLSRGNYPLTRPLVLSRPVTIAGEPGAVLTFSQSSDAAAWTAAIKVHAGNTTLKDFAVRFVGPVRWRNDVSWGPAVIGTTDNLDGVPPTPKVNLTFSGLDLEGPGKVGPEAWEEAPRLIRLHGAAGGKVIKNTLRGGLVHLFDGPWQVVENEYRGTPPATYSHGVFVVHEPHDLVIRKNRAKPVGSSGKTWRFLILVRRGDNVVVEDNAIEGIGPRDDDTIPSMNAPEIILTESYHLWYEGRPSAVSTDGRLVKVRQAPSMTPRSGDVVSILSGTGAGQWRRIAQRIEPTVYLLDDPLPKGAWAVSIGPGFVGQVYAGNSIDARAGRAAAGFVLAGNHFGTVVKNNRVVGAGDAFQVMASASETPNTWGWTHAPLLGVVLEGNTIEDSERGGTFGISHGGLCKSNKGRIYMTLALRDNTVRWSEPFLTRLARAGVKRPAAGITLGYAPSLDPGELVVEERGDRLVAPGGAAETPALKVHAAWLNGRATTNRAFALTGRPASAATGRTGAAPREGQPRR